MNKWPKLESGKVPSNDRKWVLSAPRFRAVPPTCRPCRPVLCSDMNRAQVAYLTVALYFASVFQCCADEPLKRNIRDSETRRVATRCGLYKDAVAKDEVIAQAIGHRVIVVDRYAVPRAHYSGAV